MIAPTWTKSMVQHRLVEADRVIFRTTEWPMKMRTRASDVPQYIRTEEDRMDILRAMHERLKIEGFYDPKTGRLVRPVPFAWGKGLPPTDSIQRAEEAFWWPAIYLTEDAERICVMTFVEMKAKRTQGFPRICGIKLAKAGYDRLSQRAAYRLKDDGLRDIAYGLNEARVPIAEMEEAG